MKIREQEIKLKEAEIEEREKMLTEEKRKEVERKSCVKLTLIFENCYNDMGSVSSTMKLSLIYIKSNDVS